mmetsp:Transcript_22050/g.33322  ORF Transcript_22050/g.33322 Transcript_22050/m.33322 type:complete len:318 (-) Transcript_22050:196-1149(-)|eukprot:CAMPEP_0178901106 /NCGR_PEP_ID=MMETSP0786-20121207/3832_1 /TAXON_ID=186022 /ORGANISM="Thalassionema frauenfeldii, Strain CCMP 1798" /LENGTH=317 /DNA_ID=CAMNT_0020572159 /DNA_START=153 /DNA_END=1106 /DNA_ORIENTATION=+
MRVSKRDRKKPLIPDEMFQIFSRNADVPQLSKQPTFKEFDIVHQKVISNIKSTTTFIQSDVKNEKAAERIVKTNFVMKQHLKYIKEKQQKLKKWSEEFQDDVAMYEMAKMAYVIRRDQLKTNEIFKSLLNVQDGKSVKIPVLTSLVEATPRTWTPHTDEYLAKKQAREKQSRKKLINKAGSETLQQLEDTIDTLKKANSDILKLEKTLKATAEMPKRRAPIVDQFKDLQIKTDNAITKADQCTAKTQAEISEFKKVLKMELIDDTKVDRCDSDDIYDEPERDHGEPTEFRKALIEYRKYREMVIPLVDDRVSECICM